jgi:hypothetical protein
MGVGVKKRSKKEPWECLGIAAEPDPIRLRDHTGDRQTVLSFDSNPAWQGEVVGGDDVVEVDWRRVISEAGFSRQEAAVFRAYFQRLIPTYLLAKELGITPKQAAQYLAAVCAKLPRAAAAITLRPGSVFAFQERLPSGRRSWEFARFDNAYLEVMQKEFSPLLSMRSTRSSDRLRSLSVVSRSLMNIAELQKRLKAEIGKRDRLAERAHGARVALSQAEGAVEQAAAAARREQAAAALDEREWPGAELQQELALANAGLVQASSKLEALVGALEQQGRVIVDLESDIHSRRHELLAGAIGKARAEAFSALEEFTRAAVRLRGIARDHGFPEGVPLGMLFADYNPSDPLSGWTERNAKIQMLNSAGQLNDLKLQFSKAV